MFCAALAGDQDGERILRRDEHAFVTLAKYPYNPGHLLVLPTRHVGELEELTADENAGIAVLLQRGVRALRAAAEPHGFNVGLNLGRVAGAGIPEHLHWHIVPRWGGDTNFMPVVGQTRVLPELLAETLREARAALRRLMDGTIALVDGGHLAFEDVGDGPAVVLLHPGLWDMRTWDRQMATFTEAGYRVIRYDLRGYGLSSRPTAEPYSHVADLCSLLDTLEVEQAALVGCSMGGAVAIDTTLTVPDRVWALVTVAAGLGGFEPNAEEEELVGGRRRRHRGGGRGGRVGAGPGPPPGDLGAARHRRRGGGGDPADRVRQHPRADDGRERRDRARPARGPPAA